MGFGCVGCLELRKFWDLGFRDLGNPPAVADSEALGKSLRPLVSALPCGVVPEKFINEFLEYPRVETSFEALYS